MSILLKPLKIGKIVLKSRIILAPMVDVTNLAYRKICRDSGAALAYTEMINIGAILHENEKTQNMMRKYDGEKPVGIQITGNSESDFEKVIPFLKDYDLVDINCGCPSSRITDNESGSYLLKSPEKIGRMIKILKKSGLTVTAKIRLGFKENNVMEVVKVIEKAGADALTVHARLSWQRNREPADWYWIAKVKKSVKIPVIGNGDVDSGRKAEEMLKIADGVMIARAAIGNPLIFRDILNYLKTGEEVKSDFFENLKLFAEYLRIAKEYNIVDITRIKSIGGYFLRGIREAGKMRQGLMSLRNFDEIEDFVDEIISKVNLGR